MLAGFQIEGRKVFGLANMGILINWKADYIINIDVTEMEVIGTHTCVAFAIVDRDIMVAGLQIERRKVFGLDQIDQNHWDIWHGVPVGFRPYLLKVW